MSRLKICVVEALFAAVFAASGFAQESRATLSGHVVDPSGALVPAVKVTALNLQTGVAAASQSTDSGVFTIRFLLPGQYRITAEKPGFKTYSRDNLQLRVGDSVDVTVPLELGNLSETVRVEAATPLLETADASLNHVIDERRLMELPQRGGNPLELERLSPGTVNLTTMRIMKLSSPDGTSSTSVNGSGNFSTQYSIDGVNNTVNDRGRGYARVAFIPPSAAITEFKMEANPYDARAGSMGPVINVGTRSGSNEVRGLLYYWSRNSAFDSANFFDNKAGLKKVVYQDHRFGATIGGPILRNRTFFFYSWEENRFGQPSTSNQTSTVPTAAERNGDFSALLALGSSYQIYNPFTTRAAATAGRFQRDPFAGNLIPRGLLNPVGANLLTYYPLPSQPSTVDGRNNYYFPDVRIQQYDSHLARVDHSFTPNHRLFLRLNHFGYTIPKDLLGVPATKEIFNQYNRGAALDDVIVLSPTLILNLRYGIVAADFPEKRVTQGTDLTTLGFSPAFAKLLDPKLSTVPRVAVSGFATLSNWSDGDGRNTAATHNLVADLTKLKGAHTLKLGAAFGLARTWAIRYQTSISPDLSFANTYTRGPLDNSTAAPLGQELAALLLGIPGGSMTQSPTPNVALQSSGFGLYLQDDFKVNRKLSLNLGLRYQLDSPLTERYDRLVAGFAAGAASPIAAQATANYAKSPIPELPASAFAVNGGLTFVNQNGSSRSPYDSWHGALLPRLGLGLKLTPNTVLRGGYGIYFGSLGVEGFIPIQSGFSQSTPIQASLDNGVTYIATLTNPLPNGLIAAQGARGGLSTNLGQAIQFLDAGLKHPYSQRWSVGIQRQLPAQILIDVAYVGNRSTHLAATQQLNTTPAKYLSTSPVRDQATINFLTTQVASPFSGLNSVYSAQISRAALLSAYPQFGNVSVARSMGYSWYNSLQTRLEKRLSKGATITAIHTYAKFMQATEFQNATDPRPYRVISDMDRPQVFTLSALVEIPVGRGRKVGADMPAAANAILGGWQFQSTAIRQAGAPLGFGSNPLFIGNIKDIPLPKSQRSPDRWFNTAAGFNRTTAQQLANNIITFPMRLSGVRSDGQAAWNFSLLKNWKLKEKLGIQFRAECYNAMNHPNFDTPNTTPTNSSFGISTAVVSEPRNWQFALRLTF